MASENHQEGGSDPNLGVSPEMALAGLEVYFGFDHQLDDPEELVREVFLAMIASRSGHDHGASVSTESHPRS